MPDETSKVTLEVSEDTLNHFNTAKRLIEAELPGVTVPLSLLMEIQLSAVSSTLIATQFIEAVSGREDPRQLLLPEQA